MILSSWSLIWATTVGEKSTLKKHITRPNSPPPPQFICPDFGQHGLHLQPKGLPYLCSQLRLQCVTCPHSIQDTAQNISAALISLVILLFPFLYPDKGLQIHFIVYEKVCLYPPVLQRRKPRPTLLTDFVQGTEVKIHSRRMGAWLHG